MHMETISKAEFLQYLLTQHGFTWNASGMAGRFDLKKDDFIWTIDPFAFDVTTLIEMLIRLAEANKSKRPSDAAQEGK